MSSEVAGGQVHAYEGVREQVTGARLDVDGCPGLHPDRVLRAPPRHHGAVQDPARRTGSVVAADVVSEIMGRSTSTWEMIMIYEISKSADGSRSRAFMQVAEADGNRTRRRRGAPSTGFEDRGDHQVP